MVYKLHKATRFLFIKVFIGIFIFSLIIGMIASVVVGLAITFDTESFSPELQDNQGNIVEGCNLFYSENCNWSPLVNFSRPLTDLQQQQFDTFAKKYQQGNYIPLYQGDNVLVLTKLVLFANGQPVCYDFSFRNPNNVPQCTVAPYYLVSDTQSNTTSNQIVVNKLLMANTTKGPVKVCDDAEDSNTCKFIYDQSSQIFKAPIDNITVTQNSCLSFDGQIKAVDKVSTCSIIAYKQYVSPGYLGADINVRSDFPSEFNNINKTYCPTVNNSCNDFVDFPSKVFYENSSVLEPATIRAFNILSNENILPDIPSSYPNDFNQPFVCNFDKKGSLCSNINTKEFSISRGEKNPYGVFIGTNKENLSFLVGKIAPGQSVDTFQILPKILNPRTIITAFRQIIPLILILIAINIAFSFIVIILGLWRRLGKRITPKFALSFKGRIGYVLELTQFFEFSGDWFLESIAVHEYDFRGFRPAFKELVTERWRDTIFFPVSLVATLSLLIVTLTNKPELFLSLLIIAPVLPLLLAFWTPFIWIIDDSGLKRVNYGEPGDINAINRISTIIRDGFNKLVGIGALLGLGTAGSSAIRSTYVPIDQSILTSSFENLITFNFNFIISAAIWTIAL
ncbi:MAG: hypothetical protein ACFFD1_13070, partial [Candidatus Thorarchaeota archaeon]